MPYSRSRKTNGTGIVEGVVGLIMIAIATVMAVLILINVGGATYHKEKIGLVAQQAATYATLLPGDSTRQPLVATMVDQMFDNMGVNASNTNVVVSDLTVASREAVRVRVETSVPTMMAGNFSSVLPLEFRMSDSAVSIKNSRYTGYASGTILSTGQRWTAPMINSTGDVPNDDKEAYAISLPAFLRLR